MSADIYAKVDSRQKVRYIKKEQDDRTEWEEREVDIYESAEVCNVYLPHEEGQQVNEKPAAKKRPVQHGKVFNMLLWILLVVVIITMTTYLTLQVSEMKKSSCYLEVKLAEMEANYSQLRARHLDTEANYSQLQSSFKVLSKNYSLLTDEVKVLKNTFEEKSCPGEWTRFGSSCYLKGQEKKTWYESREYCQDRGADLVIINSEAEQEFVKKFNNNGKSWIGLERTWTSNYEWKWVDGSSPTQSFWETGWPPYSNPYGYAICCNAEGKWIQDDYNYDYNYNSMNWICEK